MLIVIYKNNQSPTAAKYVSLQLTTLWHPSDTGSLYFCWLRSTTMTRIPKKAIFSLCGPFHRGYKTCRLCNKGAWLEPSSFVGCLQNSWILIYLDIRHSRVGSQAESSCQILEGEASEVLSKGGAGSVRRKNVIFLYNPCMHKTPLALSSYD